jgi:hypothetical protein
MPCMDDIARDTLLGSSMFDGGLLPGRQVDDTAQKYDAVAPLERRVFPTLALVHDAGNHSTTVRCAVFQYHDCGASRTHCSRRTEQGRTTHAASMSPCISSQGTQDASFLVLRANVRAHFLGVLKCGRCVVPNRGSHCIPHVACLTPNLNRAKAV